MKQSREFPIYREFPVFFITQKNSSPAYWRATGEMFESQVLLEGSLYHIGRFGDCSQQS